MPVTPVAEVAKIDSERVPFASFLRKVGRSKPEAMSSTDSSFGLKFATNDLFLPKVMGRFTAEISLLSRRVNLLEAAEKALINVTETME